MSRILNSLLVLVTSGGLVISSAAHAQAQGEVIVGNPPGGGLSDGTIISGGTQTTNVVPVNFQVFPARMQLRVVTEQVRKGATTVTVSEQTGVYLTNLALGRAVGTPLNADEILALAVGDDAGGSHRLIVFNRTSSTQTAIVARGQKEDIVQDIARKVGLLKWTFVAGGGTEHAISGGTFQLTSCTFSTRKGMSILAGGNGVLDFTSQSVAKRAVLTSVNLQVAATQAGLFTD